MKTQTFLMFDCARHYVGLGRFAGKPWQETERLREAKNAAIAAHKIKHRVAKKAGPYRKAMQ